MLDEAIISFRKIVRLTGRHNSRFLQRISDLIDTLGHRFGSDQWSHLQQKLDRQEIINWVAEAIRAKLPSRASEKAAFIFEIGYAIKAPFMEVNVETSERLDLKMNLYLKAAETNTIDVRTRASSWREIARVLIDQGDLLHNVKYYERSKEYLDKIEDLKRSARYQSGGHLPLLACLHHARYDHLHTPDDAIEAAKVYHRIFHKSSYNAEAKIEVALICTQLIVRVTTDPDPKSKQFLVD